MLLDSDGRQVLPEESIFPLISFNPNNNEWKCVGTGFFIQSMGGFVTAKHVFYNNNGVNLPTLYAIQTINHTERHLRPVKQFVPHQSADIAVGFLGNVRLPDGANILPHIATAFQLDFNSLQKEDSIRTFAFPLTERTEPNQSEYEFTFTGKWADGKVIDFHTEGSGLLKNPCYQTTVNIKHGASGGPVLKNNLVVGVNSTGMDVSEGDPISFITPITFIAELSVKEDGRLISISDLISSGHIRVKAHK